MADHSKPLTTSTYANFVTELDSRFDDLAVGIDPAVTTATNVPTNTIRWTSASNKWQKWNGTTWGDLSASYAINISGTAGGLSTALVASSGGTGQSSYAVGDLLYASTTTALSKLADVATGNALISGGVGVAPSWGKIALTTHVSGTLPTANGGTNLTAFTANGAVYASSTSVLTTGTLPIASGGTNNTATPTNGAVAYGTGTAIAYSAAGTSGQVLVSAGAASPTWNTITLETLPSAWTKTSVVAATTANITLSAPQTIDGVAVIAGNRVLVKNQTLPAENGIYVVAAGAWTRATDSDAASEIANAEVGVNSGTANGGRVFTNTFKSTDTVGTTAMNWFRVVNNGDITPATLGGTDQSSYAVGDILYASTTTALSKLADVATGNSLISGGVGVAPSWGKIGLTTHITGTLALGNGGTGQTTAQLSMNALAGATTAANYLRGNGTNVVMSTIQAADVPTLNQNTSGTAAGLSATLVVGSGGTGLTSYTAGDLVYASGTTTLAKLADVATGNALLSGGVGVAPAWGQIGLTTHVTGTLPIANGGTNATTADTARVSLNVISSTTGSEKIPAGTTAQRDGSPAAGWFRFNTTTTKFEGYNGTSWGSVGGGATGGAGDEVFVENNNTITTSYTLGTNRNAMSVSPLTVNAGVVITVPAGQRWVIL